jgi:hypothetical protein
MSMSSNVPIAGVKYISANLAAFDRDHFAVFGSEKVGSLVGQHLLHAVHQIFVGEPPGLGRDPAPNEVMKLARELKGQKCSNARRPSLPPR